MDIYSLGHSSFRIKGKTATVITDPFDAKLVGFPFPKHTLGDIVTVSHNHPDHNQTDLIEGSPFIISGPGEYEIKGVSIIGMQSYHDEQKGKERGTNTIYNIEIDGIHIVHAGDLGNMLTNDEVEKLDGVDILMIPVGAAVTLGMEKVTALISEIEPMIVIPMHYKTAKHNQEKFGELNGVDAFLAAMGKSDIQPVPKLSMTKDKLPSEMQIVVIE